MRLAIAVSILAQTIPVCADYYVNYKGKHVARTKRIEILSGTPTKKSNGHQLLSAVAPFRQNKVSEMGVLENSYSSNNVVECDPNANEADIGILYCGMNHYYCMESETSLLGGICVDPSAGS